MAIYLGVDIGTSGTKTLAIRETGQIVGQATANYPISHPRPGWSEQNPEDWFRATVETIGELIGSSQIDPAEVAGIGLSGQMHGSVFLDSAHQVIRPALLWNDQRTARECEEITEAAGGRAQLIAMVANPALTGFTAPKILWLRNQEPENFERCVKVLLPKDFVRLRLTGEFATEVSDASGTLLLDVKQRQWSAPLLSALQLDRSLLPDVYESEEVSGRLSESAARQLGLPTGIPVVGGGGDNAVGAIGNGIVRRGTAFATMGTSGVIFTHSDEVQVDPQGRVHTFCHAVHGKWHVMGVVLSAGGSLQWYRNQFGEEQVRRATEQGKDAYDLLLEEAATAPAGSEGLFFLPYLTGERTPHADPHARGAWIGLTPRHGRAQLVRSIMEGATYAMRDSLEIIRGMGIPVEEIRLGGGGARPTMWRQMQADVYGTRCVLTNASEGPAYGAALLAATGTGAYAHVEEACDATITITERFDPESAARACYERHYPIYGKLYHSLRDDFAAIAELVNPDQGISER